MRIRAAFERASDFSAWLGCDNGLVASGKSARILSAMSLIKGGMTGMRAFETGNLWASGSRKLNVCSLAGS